MTNIRRHTVKQSVVVAIALIATIVLVGRAWAQGSLTGPGNPTILDAVQNLQESLNTLAGQLTNVTNQLTSIKTELDFIKTELGTTQSQFSDVPPVWDRVLSTADRFVLVMGGAAVLDHETGLVWDKSPSTDTFTHFAAHNQCNTFPRGGRFGWRLPTAPELASLIDPTATAAPTLPAGHPFQNVNTTVDKFGSINYWTGTRVAGDDIAGAWFVNFAIPNDPFLKVTRTASDAKFHAWCVRGQTGVDLQ